MNTNKIIEAAYAEAMRIRGQKEKGFLGRLRKWRRETDWESVLCGLFFCGLYVLCGLVAGAAIILIIKYSGVTICLTQ